MNQLKTGEAVVPIEDKWIKYTGWTTSRVRRITHLRSPSYIRRKRNYKYNLPIIPSDWFTHDRIEMFPLRSDTTAVSKSIRAQSATNLCTGSQHSCSSFLRSWHTRKKAEVDKSTGLQLDGILLYTQLPIINCTGKNQNIWNPIDPLHYNQVKFSYCTLSQFTRKLKSVHAAYLLIRIEKDAITTISNCNSSKKCRQGSYSKACPCWSEPSQAKSILNLKTVYIKLAEQNWFSISNDHKLSVKNAQHDNVLLILYSTWAMPACTGHVLLWPWVVTQPIF